MASTVAQLSKLLLARRRLRNGLVCLLLVCRLRCEPSYNESNEK